MSPEKPPDLLVVVAVLACSHFEVPASLVNVGSPNREPMPLNLRFEVGEVRRFPGAARGTLGSRR